MAIQSVKRKGNTKDAVIEKKDQRWHCRNRITLVFGSNHAEELETYLYTDTGVEFKTVKFHQAKSKAIEELLDNCIDEYYRGHVTEIHTYLSKDGKTITVEDNGIGMPLAKIPQVYSEFRTGSKFKDEEVDKKGFLHRTLGQNGLGAAATCLTADSFIVTVRHYNSKNEQVFKFTDGALKTSKSKVKKFKGHSGVKIEVKLSKEVYKNDVVDPALLRKRIIDLAYNNPGLAFYYNDEKFLFQKGLFELAEFMAPDAAYDFGTSEYVYEKENIKKKKVKGKIDISFSMVLNPRSEEREKFISFVNSTPTFDGGFHHDRFRRIFINQVKSKLERVCKKEKITLIDNDITGGMTLLIGITMPNPRFESQTKRKLVKDPHLEKGIENLLDKNIEKFFRKNKEYLEAIVDRGKSRQKFQDLKDASKIAKKSKKQRIEKLLDANERKNRSNCTLFICEGDSAIGGLRSSRNKLLHGGIALRGKPMNVAQSTIKDILNNQELNDLMASINLTLGQPVDFDNLRFSKIVFLADSDVDGGHINTLLTNFFFTFWPELFEQGCMQIAKAPLFEIITAKGRRYAETPSELESIKNESGIKIKEIQRNKGLGEMSPDSWKYIMGREAYTIITADDMGKAKEMLDICFGKDTSLRKELLLDEASTSKTKSKEASVGPSKKAAKKVAKKVTTKITPKKATKKATKKIAKKTTKKATKKKAKKK